MDHFSSSIITLTTDFGLYGGYVASLKGVILGINPEARVVDICHTIRPQNVLEAAFILSTVYLYFPSGTIHVVVVDPGVGSARKPLLLKMGSNYFIAPDNGVLSYVLGNKCKSAPLDSNVPQIVTRRKKVPQSYTAIEINNPDYWLKPVSNNFHGRDIFAPVAGYLSRGLTAEKFGTPLDYIHVLSLPVPYKDAHGCLHGQIMHIDSFGNLITNITAKYLEKESFTVKLGKFEVSGLQQFYAADKGLMALIGSSNYLEIALKNGNAKDFLGLDIGNIVLVEFA